MQRDDVLREREIEILRILLEEGYISNTELAKRLNISRTAAGNLMERLARKGYLERVVPYQLTPKAFVEGGRLGFSARTGI